jgi:hypothetical protein
VVGVEVDPATGHTRVFEGADVAAVRAQMRGEGSSGEGTTPPNVGEEREHRAESC